MARQEEPPTSAETSRNHEKEIEHGDSMAGN
jgi:hypothetical protein